MQTILQAKRRSDGRTLPIDPQQRVSRLDLERALLPRAFLRDGSLIGKHDLRLELRITHNTLWRQDMREPKVIGGLRISLQVELGDAKPERDFRELLEPALKMRHGEHLRARLSQTSSRKARPHFEVASPALVHKLARSGKPC